MPSTHSFSEQQQFLLSRVKTLCVALKQHKMTFGGKTLVLYHTSSEVFLIRLLAAAHAGFDIIFPANGQTENIETASLNADYVFVDSYKGAKQLNAEMLAAVDTNLDADDGISALTLPQSGKLTFYTSGSTGYGKPIEKNWGHINAEVANLEHTFCFEQPCQIVATVSHQHIYGLLFKLLWPLFSGYTIEFTFVEFPEQLQSLVLEKNVVIISSPAFIDRLIRDNVLMECKDKIIGLFSSGGPLSDISAIRLFEQLGIAATQIYGSTETGGIAYRQVTQSAKTAWQCFDGITVTTKEQQLAVCSPYFDEDVFITQDMVELLENGQFMLLGRLDRTIKLEEKRVNLDALERTLCADKTIQACKVIVLTKGKRQQLGLVASLTDDGFSELNKHGKLALNKHLKRLLSGRFEAVCMPRKFRYLASLPVNSQGKLVFAELEKLFD